MRIKDQEEKRVMNERTEGAIAILAAFFVLFSALLAPLVSVVIAIVALAALGVYKLWPRN
jgi:hypothetical protein